MRKNDLVEVNGVKAVVYDVNPCGLARVRNIDLKEANKLKLSHLGLFTVKISDMKFIKRTTKQEREWDYCFPANWEN